MEKVHRQIEVIESNLRIHVPSRLRDFWLRHPEGVAISSSVEIRSCPTTKEDFLERIYGVHPVNEVLSAAKESLWLLIQQAVPIGAFASSSILVWRIGDDEVKPHMIDIYEDCSNGGPKTLYPVIGLNLSEI
jgi:hypothetical protein